MNQDQQCPEGHPRRAADQAEPLRRLGEIERRLRAHSPRSVRFDAEAIVQAARAAGEYTALSERLADHRRARRVGLGAITVSWLCGAVAGVLATVLFLNNTAPSSVSSERAVAQPSGAVDRAGQGDQPQPGPGRQVAPRGAAIREQGRTRSRSPIELLLAAMLRDSHRAERTVLRAGALASSRLAAEALRLRSEADVMLQEGAGQPVWNGDVPTAFPDEQPMTRDQLLQKLLQEQLNSLL
jgi:hypothetical protein